MTKMETKNLDRHRCALLIRGAIGIQGVKQTDLAKRLGLNRVVLNMFLNRRIDLLPDDITAIMDELEITEKAEAFLSDLIGQMGK